MKEHTLLLSELHAFEEILRLEEKSIATIEKYLRDVKAFFFFLGEREITKALLQEYKCSLMSRGYAIRSINSMLASINHFLKYIGKGDCIVKSLRRQKESYCPEEKELTKKEYFALLQAARGDLRLTLILQTICGTGIRVSELQYFTVEALKHGEVFVTCKGKNRVIMIPTKLRKQLLKFATDRGISNGMIFRTVGGKPLHRTSIWRQMKNLCQRAKVDSEKVFPHNLRKLFARTFYELSKDIARLADVLGHSSINTTRIYIMTSGAEHRKEIERLGLII